jgi:hypothetical protein
MGIVHSTYNATKGVTMLKDYRDGLMLESFKGIKGTQCKFGGSIKPQQTLGKTSDSRAYKGYTNIAEMLKAEADYIITHELIPLEAMIYAKQSRQIAQGKGSRIPAKYHKAINAVKAKISKLKREAKDLSNTVADHHYVTNQHFIKG